MQEQKCNPDMSSRVKFIRKQLGYTQEQFAMLLGCDQAAVSRMEQGKKTLDADTMCMLYEKCKININWLVTGEGRRTLEKSQANDKLECVTETEFQHIKEWLAEQSEEEPEIWAWFRVQLKKKFPEYREWLKKMSSRALCTKSACRDQ